MIAFVEENRIGSMECRDGQDHEESGQEARGGEHHHKILLAQTPMMMMVMMMMQTPVASACEEIVSRWKEGPCLPAVSAPADGCR